MYKISLYQFGFNEKEADVYLALNTFGPSPASTLARITNIKRTSVYDILNGLLAKNLIVTYQKGQTTFYAIDDLNKILYQEREKMRMAESVIKQLSKEQATQEGIPINHYIGEENYREMYEDILRANPKEIMAWLHLDKFYNALDPVQEEDWTLRRIKQGVYARLILLDTPLAREFRKKDSERLRTTVLIPKEFAFNANCFLYENHVMLFDADNIITGIRINHKSIYTLQKQIFEMTWKLFAGK
jgi:sugar-specific transcriptional regulator TrmB